MCALPSRALSPVRPAVSSICSFQARWSSSRPSRASAIPAGSPPAAAEEVAQLGPTLSFAQLLLSVGGSEEAPGSQVAHLVDDLGIAAAQRRRDRLHRRSRVGWRRAGRLRGRRAGCRPTRTQRCWRAAMPAAPAASSSHQIPCSPKRWRPSISRLRVSRRSAAASSARSSGSGTWRQSEDSVSQSAALARVISSCSASPSASQLRQTPSIRSWSNSDQQQRDSSS